MKKLFRNFNYYIVPIIIVYVIVLFWMRDKDSKYKGDVHDEKIYKATEYILKRCGDFSFMSWTVNDIKNQEYWFKEVMGCDKSKIPDCIFSAKEHNPFYQSNHHMDGYTIDYLTNVGPGQVAYYTDISPLRQLPSFAEIFDNTNFIITTTTHTVIETSDENIIYVLSFSYTDRSERKCGRNEISALMRDLAEIATSQE